VPGDAIAGLEKLLQVRAIALTNFATGALPPDRQLGDAERRFVPIYLLHRYQTEAVVRLLGGATYAYGLVGETNAETKMVPGARQQQALAATQSLLSMATLAIPESALKVLSAPSNEYARSPEYFGSRMAPVFDPLQASASASALVAQFAFDANRLNRLAWQHERDPSIPSTSMLFESLITQFWQEQVKAKANASNALARATRNWTLLDAALLTLDGGNLHPTVAARWRASLAQLAKQLAQNKDADSVDAAQWIQRYLADPASVKLRTLTVVPPGAPI
jgi:hypothetical protein